MANQSILHTKRQTSRAKATAARALAPEGEQWLALRCMAPDLVASAELFERADARVRQLEAEVRQKSVAGSSALPPLSRLYEEVRQVVSVRLGTTHPGGSTFTTPDDLLNRARDLAEDLEPNTTGTGMGPLLGALDKAIEEAATAQGELTSARKALQKAQHDREAAAVELRPLLVCFRRLVRCAFGKQSREYRELLDRRHRAKWPDGEELDTEALASSDGAERSSHHTPDEPNQAQPSRWGAPDADDNMPDEPGNAELSHLGSLDADDDTPSEAQPSSIATILPATGPQRRSCAEVPSRAGNDLDVAGCDSLGMGRPRQTEGATAYREALPGRPRP